jgi:putative hydrolase of the HAD superfamily
MTCPIRALIFDLDDTLVIEEASAEAAFIETGELAQAKYDLDPRQLHATVRKTCRELWYAFPAHPYCKKIGISSWEGMWAEFIGPDPALKALHSWAPIYRLESWRAALRIHGIEDPELALELAETFPARRRQKHQVYADTVPVLERLSRGYSLGLMTNGTPDLQMRKLEGAGIAAYFPHVLISGDIGFGKPDRRLFEIQLARMGVQAAMALMVGNSLDTDIQGAQSAGMRAVWVNRSSRPRDGCIIPDWEISSLHGLDPILAGFPE